MQKERKIALVGKKLSFTEAEESDLFFWADKSWKDRLKETDRLRRMIWTHILGVYPNKIEKVGGVVKKSNFEK